MRFDGLFCKNFSLFVNYADGYVRAAEIDAYIIHFRYFLFGLNYTVILS